MKRKMKGVLGIGLTFVLVVSMFAFAIPVSAAAPLPTINSWTNFTYPAEGYLGGWFYDPDIGGVGPMDEAIDGTLYTAVVSGVVAGINIDGSVSDEEWDGATSYDLHGATVKAYVTNDDQYMYVAFDNVSADGFVSFNVYKVGAYVPEKLFAPVVHYDGTQFWDTLEETTPGSGTFTVYVRDDGTALFSSAIGTATEIKVPLVNLGLAPGETIKMMFVFVDNVLGTGVYPLGADPTQPLTNYTDVTLLDGVLAVLGKAGLMKSDDGGRTWSKTNYAGGAVVDMVCSSLLEDVLYVTDGNYVYKSSDGADTWAPVSQPDLEQIIEGACGATINEDCITCLDVGYDAGNNPYVFIGVDVTFDFSIPDTVGSPTGPPDILYIDELAIGATWISLDLSCYDPASVYTPYAVGVTPDFATAPIKLMAVVTTNNDADSAGPETHVISSNLGVCGWGEVAELVKDCNPALHFEINHSSRIGYPDDYVDGRMLFVGVTSVTDLGDTAATDGGDVYSVITFPPPGLATDLNVAGSVSGCIGLTEGTNICGLDVCGDTADAAVIAGAMNTTAVFTSLDGGWTWVTSLKDPTGVDETWVQWIGADCGASALAATNGCDCAVSITCGPNVGLYWNQASLIDTCFDCVQVVDHSPGYYEAGVSDTLFMLSVCNDPCVDEEPASYSVFRYVGDPALAATSSPAHPWERVFSSRLYAAEIDDTNDAIHMLMVSPDFQDTEALYIGNTGFEFWRSLDAGCSWFKLAFPCAPRPTATAATVVDKETVVVGGDGVVYKTTRHGTRHWNAATVTGAGYAMSFDFDGNNFLMGDDVSQVFISTDAALTWAQVDAVLGAVGNTSVAFDPGYAVSGDPGENTIYASALHDIYRCVIDPIFPMALQTWFSIYDDAGANFWGMVTAGDTALYVGDKATTVIDSDGGMVRSLNPTAPVPFIVFERITDGLTAGDRLSGLPLTSGVNGCPNSNVLWTVGIGDTCPEVWFFEDTLATPVIPTSPSDGAKLVTTDSAILEWEKLCTATFYDVELWYFCPGCLDKTLVPVCEGECCDCATLVPCVGCSGETCCEIVALPFPGTTYYWRARVCTGYPMLSKWSATSEFTTALGAVPFVGLCSPPCGGEDISLTTSFSWEPVPGAAGYEVEIATNEDFSPVIASGTPTINAWAAAPELDYSTTYYWRVRAVRDGVVGAWTTCLFSTEGPPPEPVEPVEPVVIPPVQEITPAWIWVIIGIGAVLVISVIILIVRTRRPA